MDLESVPYSGGPLSEPMNDDYYKKKKDLILN